MRAARRSVLLHSLVMLRSRACVRALQQPARTLHVLSLLAMWAALPARGGDDTHKPLAEWVLLPEYTLPGSAGRSTFLPRPPQPEPAGAVVEVSTPPLVLFGEHPTERRPRLLPETDLALESFTIELWLLDHVNQPVGALAAIRSLRSGEPMATLGYHGRRLHASVARAGSADADITVSRTDRLPGWRRYWRHVVLTHDGRTLRLFHNAELAGELEVGRLVHPEAGGLDFELAAYMSREPHMALENLVKAVRVYDHAAGGDEIASMFSEWQQAAEAGALIPGVLHFNAGPYLHMATQTGVNLTFETNAPTTAVIEFGERAPLDRVLELREPGTIHIATLDGLKPDTLHYYRVRASTDDGREADSGLLTFKTAAGLGAPIRFAVMGDPEARPHVNDRLAGLIWDERPDFMLQVGDLTDGGKEDHKFEWNHEYFLGLTQLNSRVPVYPAPGNGEGDLYWFDRYHDFPGPAARDGYYTFTYGDAQFFILDSNRADTQFAPGGEQHEWLKAELAKSTARWKFAAHHHPVYTSDEDDYGDTFIGEPSAFGDRDVRGVMDLYEQFGVDAVFFGHLHTYERTLPVRNGEPTPGGVVYIQAGGGGGNTEDFAPTPTWFSGKTHRGYHYVMCHLVGDRLEVRMYSDEHAMLDLYVIDKK